MFHYTMMERLAGDKHFSLLGPFENETLWLGSCPTKMINTKVSQGTHLVYLQNEYKISYTKNWQILVNDIEQTANT